MKRALLFTLSILTLAVSAVASEPVLTPDGVLFTVAAEGNTLVVTRRENMERTAIVVPATRGSELETDGRLAYDRSSRTLFVAWRRVVNSNNSEIVFSTMNDAGQWSEASVISRAYGYAHAGLQLGVTRGASDDGQPTTFVNAIWWKESPAELIAEYGLVAIDASGVVSTAVADLNDVAGLRSALSDGVNAPETTKTYPPLALAVQKDWIDVVFGSRDKASFTRIGVQPTLVKGNARIWKPLGRGTGARVPYTRINAALGGQAETHISGDRVVVFTADAKFRYAVFENGVWSSVRSIPLDATMTAREVAAELRRSVAQ